MSDMIDITGMSESDRFARFGNISPDITGLFGYFPDQADSLEGYEKSYISDLVRTGLVGTEIIWFCPVWDSYTEKPVLGVFAGTVTKCTDWTTDTHYVRFEHNETVRTVKANHWVFTPKQ